jgi:threonine/homoserine/homoserine lactone efflux protein
MDLLLLGRAVLLGFTIAAAIGPISLLTIRRTLAHGQLYGLASGLGVASADAVYAAVAAFGLTAVSDVLVGGRVPLAVAGGAVLAYLGIRTMLSRPTEAAPLGERPGLAGAFASIFGLTLTNPMTILSFVALFAVLGTGGRDGVTAVTLVLGVFLGSALWWVVLTSLVAWLRARLTVELLARINLASGVVLLLFAAASIAAALAGS